MNRCHLSLWNLIPVMPQTAAANSVCTALFSESCSHRPLPQASQKTSCRVQTAAAAWTLSPLSSDSSGGKLSLGKMSNTSQGKNDSSRNRREPCPQKRLWFYRPRNCSPALQRAETNIQIDTDSHLFVHKQHPAHTAGMSRVINRYNNMHISLTVGKATSIRSSGHNGQAAALPRCLFFFPVEVHWDCVHDPYLSNLSFLGNTKIQTL